MGVPLAHLFFNGIFHEINQPFGVFHGIPISGNLHMTGSAGLSQANGAEAWRCRSIHQHAQERPGDF